MKRILLLLMAMAKLSARPVEAQLAAVDHDWLRVMPCRIHDGGTWICLS